MIYLDNNAFTILDPVIKEELDKLLSNPFGNASSQHRYGQVSKAVLVEAYHTVSKFLKVHPDELVFTSGATEALNMVILGSFKKGHIITSSLEHPSVLYPLKKLEKMGVPVTYLDGLVTIGKIEQAFRDDTTHLIFMAVNNETGIKNDIESIANFAEKRGVQLFVDGVAWLGKELFTIPQGVSCMCFSSHKIHGPMGVGLAYIRKGVKIDPFILGGPQQRGKRGGTENIAAIFGFAKAIELLQKKLPDATKKMEQLKSHFEDEILKRFPKAIIHGKNEPRICNVSNIAFPDIDGEMLLMRLDLRGVAASLGAACSTGGIEPSHVLLNMGIHPSLAASSLRFSLSRNTTESEIDQALHIIHEEVHRLRINLS